MSRGPPRHDRTDGQARRLHLNVRRSCGLPSGVGLTHSAVALTAWTTRPATHVTEGTKPCRLSARQEKYRRWSHQRKYLRCQLLLRAGTNAQFDEPFFDVGADHIWMVFL